MDLWQPRGEPLKLRVGDLAVDHAVVQILVVSGKVQHSMPGEVVEDHSLFAVLTRVKSFKASL